MPIARGDIVLANLPFSDGSGSKVRPALVVQNDANNAKLGDIIVAISTSTTKLARISPTQILIDLTTPDGKATNLLHTPAVMCERLITIDQRLVHKTIGGLSTAMMLKIDECLKASLQIP